MKRSERAAQIAADITKQCATTKCAKCGYYNSGACRHPGCPFRKDSLKIGDIVEVHFIKFAGPDEWRAARVIHVEDNKFNVEFLEPAKTLGSNKLMALRMGGSTEKVQQWRRST